MVTQDLRTLIDSAEKLSFAEQLELLKAVSQFLSQNYQQPLPQSSFWTPKTIEEIVQEQQTPIMTDVNAYKADFWPEDESVNDFIHYIYQQRQEGIA